MSSRPPIIGITLGDINGVGPEVTLAAVTRLRPGRTRIVLIGDRRIVAAEARRARLPLPPAWTPSDPPVPPAAPVVCWDPEPDPRLRRQPGRCTVRAARAAATWLRYGADAARAGVIDALVTAPIQKEGFHKAGIETPGHTEWLARHLAVAQVEMMLLAGDLRVVLATRHIPLRAVADALSPAGLKQTIRMTAEALDWLGARQRRVAVCGLNPHAGDGGVLGDEEKRWIRPAIRAVRRKGLTLTGPVPADTVFHQARHGLYDAVIALYHDQGLAPFKALAFERGVNLTLGLPIVRTSPDHGTAYDLAGRGLADPSSMQAAIRLAIRLARRPNPWRRS